MKVKEEEKAYSLFGSMFLRKLKQMLGRLIIPRLPVNTHVFRHIRAEVNAIWVRLNNRVNPFYIIKRTMIVKQDNLSVNVGCGPFGQKGWVNLDLMNVNNVTLRYDCRKGLPFRENSVMRIRCEQFLEHMDFKEEVPFFLASCFKSLKKNGVLRIIVPDAEKYLLAYQFGGREGWSGLGWDLDNLPDGFTTQMGIINFVFRQHHEHAHAYDFKTLESILRKTGFEKIIKSEFGVSVDAQLRDDLPNHKPDSLYVEAIK